MLGEITALWVRSFSNDTNKKIRLGISDLLIWDKKCESQKSISRFLKFVLNNA